ncbi:DUF2877 domain-containing protein [Cryptosporangium sp. NPDC051539]|uniref:oxamate carbamoyltransferase subunit AllH family protein n=1 Tax=Cryptosporangium sp. NPDC051539 TaxID=3363962 RepID=UPI00378833D8
MQTTLSGAASVSVAPILSGPVRAVPVIASLPTALWAGPVCLASAGAVRVPCALVLGPGVAVPAAAVGSTAEIGAGHLKVGDTSVAVTRWWRPSRPVLNHDDLDARQRALRSSGTRTATEIDVPELDVRTLLGRGEGLTPLGDDVLAGALVTLVAAAHPHAAVLGSRVAEELAARPGATTPISAVLLAHAARGECIPQLAAVLTDPVDRLEPAITALLAVGHSSGAGLLSGVRMGLTVLEGGQSETH